MSRLNRATMRKVLDTLESSAFTYADFDVAYPDDGQPLLTIKFRPEPAYAFYILDTGTQLWTREIPGGQRNSEDIKIDNILAGLKRIPTWAENIRSDLRASNPVYDELDDLRTQLGESIEKHVKDAEKHFSREEADDLKKRLDDLYAKFQEMQTQKAITEKELQTVKEQIIELKANVTVYPKGTFFRTAGNKLLSLAQRVSKSEATKEIVVASAKQMLGLPPS